MKITFRIVFKCSENKWTYSYSFLWRILKENANPGNKKLIFNKDERCLNGKCKKWLRITVKTRYCTSCQIISKKHCRMFFIYQVFCAILFQRFLLKPCFLAITLFQLIQLYRKKNTLSSGEMKQWSLLSEIFFSKCDNHRFGIFSLNSSTSWVSK